ncbi:hypothetical protein CYLTODRAFT_418666 [Cylindrobasidium torrendii FP15055 ss-10]|uniref:Uncharacterized protein n=1 Tax=Cylindrobasidium torrendii FP15055 ss-10 TaxID=1314674 RepID=A0A0D7BN35_9AGAR|nr:hypothetical protein CYLTODRAFT_418666 [Cylindrobasidium torrendii FP15055 ss-10]
MDIPSLLSTGPEGNFFAYVVSWLEGVTRAVEQGELCSDPNAPANDGRDWSFYNTVDDTVDWPRWVPAGRSMAPIPTPETYGYYVPALQPSHSTPAYSSPPLSYHPSTNPAYLVRQPQPLDSVYKYPPQSATPQSASPSSSSPTSSYPPMSFAPVPQTFMRSSAEADKLQHALYSRQRTLAQRQQYSVAHPALCSEYDRAHRLSSAQVSERRRRSFQTTPYFRMTLPYIAS